MEDWAIRLVGLWDGSAPVRGLLLAIPVAITVAGLAGWRAAVPRTLPLALWGTALCLWLLIPLSLPLVELVQFRRMVAAIGWVWLVGGWGRLVLTEWPAPTWGHWLVGTLLLALPVVVVVELIRL